jgi:MFS family permease
VNIALPTAQTDLGFSDSARQWIVTAYALAFGSLLLLGGRIADIVGRKWVFVVGLVGFALASAAGGAAVNVGMLIGARAVQGMFAALLAPAILSLLTTTFTDPAERGKAFGVFGAIAGAGASVGLLLGGFLTEYADWRWTMFVNLIFADAARNRALLVTAAREVFAERGLEASLDDTARHAGLGVGTA